MNGLLKQKLLGIGLLVLTAIAIPLTEGDITFAFFTIPIALVCIFCKENFCDTEFDEVTEEDEELYH